MYLWTRSLTKTNSHILVLRQARGKCVTVWGLSTEFREFKSPMKSVCLCISSMVLLGVTRGSSKLPTRKGTGESSNLSGMDVDMALPQTESSRGGGGSFRPLWAEER